MNEILDHDIDDQNDFDGNLFVGILTSPRQVFRYLHKHAYDKHVWKLMILSGIIGYMDASFFFIEGDIGRLFKNIFMAIFAGGFLALVLNYFYAYMLSWIGKFFDGTEDTQSILRVIAYSMIPSFFGILITVVQLIFYKSFLIYGEFSVASKIEYIIASASIFITVLWPFALIAIGLSEIQKFTIWKAILNVFISFLFFVVLGVLLFIVADMFFFNQFF